MAENSDTYPTTSGPSTAVPAEHRKRTVLKMSLYEKALVLRKFIDRNITKVRGPLLQEMFGKIAEATRARTDVRATTKVAISIKSLDTYRRNYAQPLQNTVKDGGPFKRKDDGGLDLGEGGMRLLDEDLLADFEERTKGAKEFWRNLVEFDKLVTTTVHSSQNSVSQTRTMADDVRGDKREKRKRTQQKFALDAKRAAKKQKKQRRNDRLAQQHRMAISQLFAKLQSQNVSALHAIANVFAVKNGMPALPTPQFDAIPDMPNIELDTSSSDEDANETVENEDGGAVTAEDGDGEDDADSGGE